METNRIVYSYDAPSRTLEWIFGDGSTVSYQHDAQGLMALHEMALVHGFKQKIADAAAIARNTETGAAATIAGKRDAMQKVVDQLNDGEWNAVRTGGTGNVGGLLAQAIANIKKMDIAKVREFLKSKTKAQRDAIGAKPEFAEEMARLWKERAKGVDITEALEELDGLV